jgi:hypothetical protein
LFKFVLYHRKKHEVRKEAAERFGITQSRISNLVRGKIDLFSTSMLLAMLEKVGFKIYENIQMRAKDLFRYHDRNIFAALPKTQNLRQWCEKSTGYAA